MHADPIWEHYHDELKGFVHRRISNPMDAEDVLQDVLLKAYARQHQVAHEERFMGWLFQIARHTIIDYYRAQKQAFSPLHEDVALQPEDGDEDESALIACMVMLAEHLPDKYRQAVIASELDEIPQHVLSEQLGLSYSGMKSRVQRGREQLRHLLETFCRVEVNQYQEVACASRQVACHGTC